MCASSASSTTRTNGCTVRLHAECTAGATRAVIISSEPLENDSESWKLIPKYVCVGFFFFVVYVYLICFIL